MRKATKRLVFSLGFLALLVVLAGSLLKRKQEQSWSDWAWSWVSPTAWYAWWVGSKEGDAPAPENPDAGWKNTPPEDWSYRDYSQYLWDTYGWGGEDER
jgi:hypothetical protein